MFQHLILPGENKWELFSKKVKMIRRYYLNEILAILLIVSYIIVFKNDKQSYLESKFWLQMKQSSVKALIPLQLAAAVGALLWVKAVRDSPPRKGLLGYSFCGEPLFEILIAVFLVGCIVWPWSLWQPNLVEEPTLTKSVICISGLVVAAIAGVLAQAGSFQADIPWWALLGIILLNITVVLNDGIGWSARLFNN